MKNITITDLAEELGISPSTVSRALNNSPKISEKRRREINELALERGFKLRTFTRRTTNLCILIPTTLARLSLFAGKSALFALFSLIGLHYISFLALQAAGAVDPAA